MKCTQKFALPTTSTFCLRLGDVLYRAPHFKVDSFYRGVLYIMHRGTVWPCRCEGAYTYNIHKISKFLDPFPPSVPFGDPLPPPTGDVICVWALCKFPLDSKVIRAIATSLAECQLPSISNSLRSRIKFVGLENTPFTPGNEAALSIYICRAIQNYIVIPILAFSIPEPRTK